MGNCGELWGTPPPLSLYEVSTATKGGFKPPAGLQGSPTCSEQFQAVPSSSKRFQAVPSGSELNLLVLSRRSARERALKPR